MNKNLQFILIGAGVVIGLGFLLRQQVTEITDAIGNINEETPFEGAGVIGTAGNLADQASGGVLSDVGSAVGLFFSKLLNFRAFGEFR